MPVRRNNPGCPCCCCYEMRPNGEQITPDTSFSCTIAGHPNAALNGAHTLAFSARTANGTCYDYYFAESTNVVLYLPANGSYGTWVSTGTSDAAHLESWNLIDGIWVNEWAVGATLTFSTVTYSTKAQCTYCHASVFQEFMDSLFNVTVSDTPWEESFTVEFSAPNPLLVPGDACYWPEGPFVLTRCGRFDGYNTSGAEPEGPYWNQIPEIVQSKWDIETNSALGECATDSYEYSIGSITNTVDPPAFGDMCPCDALLFCGSVVDGGQTYYLRLLLSYCQDLYSDDSVGVLCAGAPGTLRGPYHAMLYGWTAARAQLAWTPTGGATGWQLFIPIERVLCASYPEVTSFEVVP